MTRRTFVESMAAFAAGRAFAAPSGMFAGDGARLVFAAMSDIHVCHPKTGRLLGTEVFERALEWYRRQGIDAVLVAGDLAEHGLVDELEMIGEAWRRMFPDGNAPDGRHVEKVFVTGNHDYVAWAYGDFAKKLYPDDAELERHKLAAHYAEAWKAAFEEEYEPIYMKDVRGYKFIGSHWTGEEGEEGGEEWFGERLSGFLAAHGDGLRGEKPFFYVQHPHPRGTVFKASGAVADDGRTVEMLSGWPNAIAFSGHSHRSITDERSIWQNRFTSVNLGCLRRTNFFATKNVPKDRGYENWKTPKVYRDAAARALNRAKAMPLYGPHWDCHQGTLVQVFEDRVVIERREMGTGEPVAPDWVIPLQVAASRRPYDYDRREADSIAPQFAADAKLSVEVVSAANRGGETVPAVKLSFPAANAERGARPFDYRVEVVDANGGSTVRAVLAEGADYAIGSKYAQGPSSCVLALDSLPQGPLVFKVYPGECFGKLGRPISVHFDWGRSCKA